MGELCLFQFHQHQGQQSPHVIHSNRGFFSFVSLLNDVDRFWNQKEDKKITPQITLAAHGQYRTEKGNKQQVFLILFD